MYYCIIIPRRPTTVANGYKWNQLTAVPLGGLLFKVMADKVRDRRTRQRMNGRADAHLCLLNSPCPSGESRGAEPSSIAPAAVFHTERRRACRDGITSLAAIRTLVLVTGWYPAPPHTSDTTSTGDAVADGRWAHHPMRAADAIPTWGPDKGATAWMVRLLRRRLLCRLSCSRCCSAAWATGSQSTKKSVWTRLRAKNEVCTPY